MIGGQGDDEPDTAPPPSSDTTTRPDSDFLPRENGTHVPSRSDLDRPRALRRDSLALPYTTPR